MDLDDGYYRMIYINMYCMNIIRIDILGIRLNVMIGYALSLNGHYYKEWKL